jgi:hypothetical protein
MVGAARALTLTGATLLRELRSEIKVGSPLVSGQAVPPQMTGDVWAVWDTGATGSVITRAVVDELGIQPISMTVVHGVASQKITPVYLVDFYLPMGVIVGGLNVTLGQLFNADALIGMDVINHGDFVVTNRGGKTKMSFRMPSLAETDYVEETNALLMASKPSLANREQRRAQQKAAAKRPRR